MKPNKQPTTAPRLIPAKVLKLYLITTNPKDGSRSMIFNCWAGKWQRDYTQQCRFSNPDSIADYMAQAMAALPPDYPVDIRLQEVSDV